MSVCYESMRAALVNVCEYVSAHVRVAYSQCLRRVFLGARCIAWSPEV